MDPKPTLTAARHGSRTALTPGLRRGRLDGDAPVANASIKRSGIGRCGSSGSTAATTSSSRGIRSSPGIGLISNAGARFEAPETISAKGRFENVLRSGYDPEQHLEDMALDGVAGNVLYPSQGLFYFKVADPRLMSAIFRAYKDWLADPRNARRAPVRGLPHRSRAPQSIAMINLGRRPGRDQGARARRPPGPLRCDDHRISSRGPPLRPTRIRAVLGCRRGARPALKPAHGHATAGQDPRGRSRNAARRQQRRDERRSIRHWRCAI